MPKVYESVPQGDDTRLVFQSAPVMMNNHVWVLGETKATGSLLLGGGALPLAPARDKGGS